MNSLSINNVPQESHSSLRKLALLHVQCQASFLETEQNSPLTYIMFNLIPTMDKDVVHSAYYPIKTLQDSSHGPLEDLGRRADAKG